jgi:hypothetical protein
MNDKPSLLSRRRVILALISLVVSWYAGSYWRGMMMAYIDYTCGHYEIKGSGLPAPWISDYIRLLKEKYEVGYDSVGGCMVFPTTAWYADGYNSVSSSLLVKKYSKDIFVECADEASRTWQANHPGEW